MKFQPPQNKGLNLNIEYLTLYKDLIIYFLSIGITVEHIIEFNKDLQSINIDPGLLAGLLKYTNESERYNVLLQIEKESK
jgi:hypothetical protein